MGSGTSTKGVEHAVEILYGVLGLSTPTQRARLNHLINEEAVTKEALETIQERVGGHLRVFSRDELVVAGKLKLMGTSREPSLTTSDSWFKIVSLVKNKEIEENVSAVADALIDHNIECNKIADAFQTRASRFQGFINSIRKFSMASVDRNELLKRKVEEHRARCGNLEAKLESLEGDFGDYTSLFQSNHDIVMMANRVPEYARGKGHRDTHWKCREHQIFNATTTPHNQILVKLEALGSEMRHNSGWSTALVSDARCYANDIIWSIFRDCQHILDAVFIESCASGRAGSTEEPSHARAIREERQAVLDEIQILWDEIIPVAHMVVEREFLKPFLDAIEIGRNHDNMRNATISSYASGVLRYMNQHLMMLGKRIYILTLHHQALFEAYHFALARANGSSILDLPKSVTQSPRFEADDRSSIIELVQKYLAKYGSIPIDTDPNNPLKISPESMAAKLQAIVAARESKLSTLYGQMQTLFEGAAKANLGNVEVGRAILARRIIGDSSSGVNFANIVHQDDEAEEAIRLMEDEVEAVRERFRALNSKAADAPDFVLQAYLKTHKRLAAKSCEGCLTTGHLLNSCPACRGCSEFTDFIARWGEDA